MTVTAPASTSADPATGLRVGTFGVGTFASGGRSFAALVRSGGDVIDLSDRYVDTHEIFDSWESNFGILGDLSADSTVPTVRLEELTALPPLAHPNLLCAGSNYKAHVAQMMTKNAFNQHNRLPQESDEDFYARNYALVDKRSTDGTPFFWTGLHSSLVGATDDIVLPALGEQPDWELELGVVVGRTGRFVTPDQAQSMIAGYTIVNDLGTVDIFRRTDVAFGYDWISKHQPTFKPCGPFIVPAQFVDLDETRITLRVNGDVMQDWPVVDFIFSPAQYITYASERVHLLPGDIISMGSPPGNGAHHGRFLQAGDVIDSELNYLGRQRNSCVAEDLHGRTPHFGLWTNA